VRAMPEDILHRHIVPHSIQPIRRRDLSAQLPASMHRNTGIPKGRDAPVPRRRPCVQKRICRGARVRTRAKH
jgi:hypothetical protein